MSYEVTENRVYAKIVEEDLIKGALVGSIPCIFLGSFSFLYGFIELLIYAFTNRRMWLYASIVSLLFGLVSMFIHESSYSGMIYDEYSYIKKFFMI